MMIYDETKYTITDMSEIVPNIYSKYYGWENYKFTYKRGKGPSCRHEYLWDESRIFSKDVSELRQLNNDLILWCEQNISPTPSQTSEMFSHNNKHANRWKIGADLCYIDPNTFLPIIRLAIYFECEYDLMKFIKALPILDSMKLSSEEYWLGNYDI